MDRNEWGRSMNSKSKKDVERINQSERVKIFLSNFNVCLTSKVEKSKNTHTHTKKRKD